MKNQYTSSILKKYGDSEKVPQDVKTIFEIHDRQGSAILIDCVAEKAGSSANKYKLDENDRDMLIKTLVSELENALKERL